jgi:hypothetical protein
VSGIAALVVVLASGGTVVTGATTLRLAVPPEVSSRAAARLAGDVKAPGPILILEGVEVRDDAGVTLRVSVPRRRGSSSPGATLAEAGLVGSMNAQGDTAADRQSIPARRQMLVIPLNDDGTRMVVGRRFVTLVLEAESDGGRVPLRFARAYFDVANLKQ